MRFPGPDFDISFERSLSLTFWHFGTSPQCKASLTNYFLSQGSPRAVKLKPHVLQLTPGNFCSLHFVMLCNLYFSKFHLKKGIKIIPLLCPICVTYLKESVHLVPDKWQAFVAGLKRIHLHGRGHGRRGARRPRAGVRGQLGRWTSAHYGEEQYRPSQLFTYGRVSNIAILIYFGFFCKGYDKASPSPINEFANITDNQSMKFFCSINFGWKHWSLFELWNMPKCSTLGKNQGMLPSLAEAMSGM